MNKRRNNLKNQVFPKLVLQNLKIPLKITQHGKKVKSLLKYHESMIWNSLSYY